VQQAAVALENVIRRLWVEKAQLAPKPERQQSVLKIRAVFSANFGNAAVTAIGLRKSYFSARPGPASGEISPKLPLNRTMVP